MEYNEIQTMFHIKSVLKVRRA